MFLRQTARHTCGEKATSTHTPVCHCVCPPFGLFCRCSAPRGSGYAPSSSETTGFPFLSAQGSTNTPASASIPPEDRVSGDTQTDTCVWRQIQAVEIELEHLRYKNQSLKSELSKLKAERDEWNPVFLNQPHWEGEKHKWESELVRLSHDLTKQETEKADLQNQFQDVHTQLRQTQDELRHVHEQLATKDLQLKEALDKNQRLSMNQISECSLCVERRVERMFPCGHMYCSQCIDRLHAESLQRLYAQRNRVAPVNPDTVTVKCPICRISCRAGAIKPLFFS